MFNAVYHVATLNHWRDVLAEQLPILLGNTSLKGLVMTIATDSDASARAAIDAAQAHIARSHRMIQFHPLICRLDEFEHAAMDAVDQLAAQDPDPILYFHAKGVSYSPRNELVERWRILLNRFVARADHWATFLDGSDFDTCGPFLMTDLGHLLSYFPGNFWLARPGYLRRLPRYADWVRNPPLFEPFGRYLAELAVNRQNRMVPYITEGVALNNHTWLPFLRRTVGLPPE